MTANYLIELKVRGTLVVTHSLRTPAVYVGGESQEQAQSAGKVDSPRLVRSSLRGGLHRGAQCLVNTVSWSTEVCEVSQENDLKMNLKVHLPCRLKREGNLIHYNYYTFKRRGDAGFLL